MTQSDNIGRYEIKDEIGRGGMAVVSRAYDPHFDRYVAIKILPAEFLHEPNFRARFEREAKTIAALEHPAVAPVYDFGEEDKRLFLVMRLMPGGSLADRLARGPLPVDEAARIMQRIGSALDAAHAQGIIHRDLKPGNILFDQYGEAYLSDFGIARLTEAQATLTGTKAALGTPGYMSPEQIQGEKVDARSDIYALGVIVFEMLTGKRPFTAASPAMILVKQMTEAPPHARSLQPDLPEQVDEVLVRTMAREPDKRPSTAGEMVNLLAAAALAMNDAAQKLTQAATAAGEIEAEPVPPTIVDTPPESGPQKTTEPRRSRRRLWGIAAVLIVALVIMAVFIWWNNQAAVGTDEAVVETAVEPVDSQPTDLEATINDLFTLLYDSEYDQVLNQTTALLDENPELAPIYALRSIALRETGDLDAALTNINQAIELEPETADFWYERAVTHNWRGEHEEAVANSDRCLELAPDYRDCWMERAYAFLGLDEPAAAKENLLHILEMNPEDWEANVEISWLYLWNEQDYDRAVEHINRLIDFDPGAPFNYYQRGIIYREAGDIENAAADFRLFADAVSPDDCPDCYAEATAFLEEHAPTIINVALDKPVRVSNETPDDRAVFITDGDLYSCWFAGEDAPQWVEINLEQPSTIQTLWLMIAQEDVGHTLHQIQGLHENGEWIELYVIDESTWDRKVINITPEEPWQGISVLRINTLEAESWPAWCEIRALGQIH